MSNEKITISLDDIHGVPAQPAPDSSSPHSATMPQESWGRLSSTAVGTSHAHAKASLMYRAWFYLGVAGLLAGLIAWGIQEAVPFNKEITTSDQLLEYIGELTREAERKYPHWASMSEETQQEVIGDLAARENRIRVGIWMAMIGSVLAIGLVLAETVVMRSWSLLGRGFAVGLLAGGIGGFLGGMLAQWLYATLSDTNSVSDGINATQILARSLGWALCGAFVGLSVGIPYLSPKRCTLGLVGGLAGGAIGGVLFDLVAQPSGSAVVSRAIGIVAIGCVSGVLISIAEQVAKSAWLQIEAGRLIGKQFILYRNPTRIGALPSNDVYLFKDPAIAPVQAEIQQRGAHRFLVDEGSQTGTRVNGRIVQEHRLRDGDHIQIGETVLCYRERSRTARGKLA